MFKPEQIQKIVEEIFLQHHFEFPISWVMVGVNGAFFTGRWEFSIPQNKLKSFTLSGKAKKLKRPINMMLVDRTGKAFHVLFKKSDEPMDLTNLRIEPQVGQA